MPMTDYTIESGIVAFQQGKKDLALSIFTYIAQTDPNNADAWFWLSRCLDDPEKARFCFQRAIALKPTLATRNAEKIDLEGVPGSSNEQRGTESPIETGKPQLSSQPIPHRQNADFGSSRFRNLTQKTNSSDPDKLFHKLELGLILFIATLVGFLIVATPGFLLISRGALDRFLPARPYETATPSVVLFTPTPTRSVTLKPRSTATRYMTPTPDSAGMKATVYALHFQANVFEHQEVYEKIVPVMDKAISIDPSNARSYFRRGAAYSKLISNLRDQSEYITYLNFAIKDFDKAIELNSPEYSDWAYYKNRANAYNNLAGVNPYRADSDKLYQIALDNYQLAYQLGGPTYILYYEVDMLVQLGRWNEAEEKANQIIKNKNTDDGLHQDLSILYSIKGDYRKAIDQAEFLQDGCYSLYTKSLIFYNANQKDKAFNIINQCINDSPEFSGYRYFLRALIYLDRGDYKLAKQDLDIGERNTWGRNGLHDYVLGKLLIHDGKRAEGIEYIRQGEATMNRNVGPLLLRIQKEIRNLTVDFLTPETGTVLEVTPLFTPIKGRLTPRPTWTPTSTPPGKKTAIAGLEQTQTAVSLPNKLPVDAFFALVVDPVTGAGKIESREKEIQIFHFQPESAFNPLKIENLVIHFLSPNTTQQMSLKVSIWSPKSGNWIALDTLKWGDNPIRENNEYFTNMEDFYLRIDNEGYETVFLDNISYSIQVTLQDGSVVEYGFDKPLP
jgi:tetratricopeptide (TPR) repeat protein